MKPSEFNKHITKFALVMGISAEIPTEYVATMSEVLAQVGFTDTDILECLGRMSRDTEFQTYNRYPALPEFRKYHHSGNPQIGDATRKAQFLEMVGAYLDPDTFFSMENFNVFIGRRESLAISAAGGLDGMYAAANGKYGNRTNQLKRLGDIWDSISADEKMAVRIGIVSAPGMLLGDIVKQMAASGINVKIPQFAEIL